jgi:hypothetical protein
MGWWDTLLHSGLIAVVILAALALLSLLVRLASRHQTH